MTHIIDTLTPFERLAYEYIERREAAAERHHDAEASRSNGVAWAGMGPAPFKRLSEEQLLAEARETAARTDRDRLDMMKYIADAQRACAEAHAELEACRAALSRGDGSLGRIASRARLATKEADRHAIFLDSVACVYQPTQRRA